MFFRIKGSTRILTLGTNHQSSTYLFTSNFQLLRVKKFIGHETRDLSITVSFSFVTLSNTTVLREIHFKYSYLNIKSQKITCITSYFILDKQLTKEIYYNSSKSRFTIIKYIISFHKQHLNVILQFITGNVLNLIVLFIPVLKPLSPNLLRSEVVQGQNNGIQSIPRGDSNENSGTFIFSITK